MSRKLLLPALLCVVCLGFDLNLLADDLNRWLSWQVTLSDRYLSNPVPGAKSNDVLITTGIRLTFAK